MPQRGARGVLPHAHALPRRFRGKAEAKARQGFINMNSQPHSFLIYNASMNTCLFCQIVNKESPAHILHETSTVMAFLSLENHPLIVPKKHVRDIFDLEEDCAGEIMKAAVIVSKSLRAASGCEGLNLIQSSGKAAGQDVFHFHLHIKPRWHNDDVILNWNTDTADAQSRMRFCRDIRHSLQAL